MTNPTITPDELEAAARALFPFLSGDPEDDYHNPWVIHCAQAAITAFLEVRAKKGQGDA
jgi:hypothetical protein